MGHRKDDRHYMASVKLGPKGQIVIPKEARAMFGLEPGRHARPARGQEARHRAADDGKAQSAAAQRL